MNKNAKKLGSLGGKATYAKHPNLASEVAKRQWLVRKLKDDLLKSFTVGDLANDVSFQSIRDKIQAIDHMGHYSPHDSCKVCELDMMEAEKVKAERDEMRKNIN